MIQCYRNSTSIAFLGALLVLSLSCKKNKVETDSLKGEAAKIIKVKGDNQTGEYNTILKDSLVVQVLDTRGKPAHQAQVNFIVKNGLGTVSSSYVWTDSSGIAYVKFQLACFSAKHEVVAYLCADNAKFVDSVGFVANSVKPVKWGRACGISYAVDKIRENDSKYYAVSQNKLFVSTDGGINWDPFSNLPNSSVYDIQFNSKGWMYLLTQRDGLYYSENDGKTWTSINSGIVNTQFPLSFLVEDTVIYVSYMSGGLYRTRNNGLDWKRLVINDQYNQEYSFVTRHPSGKLYLFDDWGQLWMSADYGDNWSATRLSYSYMVNEPSAFKIGDNGLLYIGSGKATIAVVSPDTYTGEVHSYYNYNSWTQSVNSIFLKDNLVYFSISGSSDSGIYSSNGWQRMDNGFYKPIRTLHLKKDGKFLLSSDDYPGGLFYE